MEQIKAKLHSLGMDANEVEWVWADAKQRYLGYHQYLRDMNRSSGKTFIMSGCALLVITILLVALLGWPSAGRQVGIACTGILAGVGAVIYGANVWLSGSPHSVRADLD